MALRNKPKVRYAVVGLGHIAQAAVLPAFENAKNNSELVAFVSDDPVKHRRLGRRYNFNGWNPVELARLGSGKWAIDLTLPPRQL